MRAGGISLHRERAEGKISRSVQLGMKIYTWLATKPKIFTFSQQLGGLVTSLLPGDSHWMPVPGFTGWGKSRDLPKPSRHPFRSWWAERPTNEMEIVIPDNVGQEVIRERELNHQDDKSDTKSLIDWFADELTALNGHFELIESNGDREAQIRNLGEQILSLLTGKDISSIMSWQIDQLPSGLVDYLKGHGIRVVQKADPTIAAGLTGVLAAIAETGTLVLHSGPERLQVASLLPEVHIAVLEARDIFSSMDQVFNLDEVLKSASVILISGPSRTADIEMTLSLGVHGPREVHVFCLSD